MLTLSVSDEGYSRNTTCAIKLISTFFFIRYFYNILLHVYCFFIEWYRHLRISSKAIKMKECKRVAPLDARVNRSLSTNSMISLSPSELNHAIMEMLNMSQAATRCDAVCRGKLICSICRNHNIVLMTYLRICYKNNWLFRRSCGLD
jgi:hypothetical protein